MTGTASEFLGENESINFEANSFDLLSSWLFGKINANCVLQDIDQYGCTVLIPTSQSIPSSEFKLIIMSPDAPEKVHTIVRARVMKEEGEFLTGHKRVYVTFINIEDGLCREINLLRAAFTRHVLNDIRCSILNA